LVLFTVTAPGTYALAPNPSTHQGHAPPPVLEPALKDALRFDRPLQAPFDAHGLSQEQWATMEAMAQSLAAWNFRINVVSRKDIQNLVPRHYLTSLAILNLFTPGKTHDDGSGEGGGCKTLSGARFLDIGTGGGFPGLPLAVACPEAHFTLCDSRQKKLKVVQELVNEFGIKNVDVQCMRVEDLPWGGDTSDPPYDYVLGRAVTDLPTFVGWGKRFYTASAGAGGGAVGGMKKNEKKSKKRKNDSRHGEDDAGGGGERLSIQNSSSNDVATKGGDVGALRWGVSRGILYMQSREIEEDLRQMKIEPSRVTYTRLGDLLVPRGTLSSSPSLTSETFQKSARSDEAEARGREGGSWEGAEELSALTVPKLKEKCRARGLRVGGRKADLIGRLLSDGGGVDAPGAELAGGNEGAGSCVATDDPRLIMAADPELGYSSVLHLPCDCF